MATTIVRSARRQHFLVIGHEALEDVRLSWAARGLLTYLLSRPDNWRIRVEHLRQQAPSGRDVIYKLLNELRRHGYVLRDYARDGHGRIRGTFYYVHETPPPPLPEIPDTVIPDTATPYPAAQEVLTNTEVQLILSKTNSSGPRTADERRLIVPAALRAEWIEACCESILEFPDALAQQLLDELAGAIKAGTLRSTPLAYLDALAKKAREGRFRPNRALSVAATRDRQGQTQAMIRRLSQEAPAAPPGWKQHPLHERLTAVAAREQARRRKREQS